MKWGGLLALSVVIAGCASDPAKPLTQPRAGDWMAVSSAYHAASEQIVDPTLKAYSQQRYTDLLLELNELGLLDRQIQQQGLQSAPDGHADQLAYQQAIANYQALLRNAPSRQGNDQVLYQLARAQDLLGQSSAALQALTQLVEAFPGSPLYREAQLRRGDYFYSAGEYTAATQAYQSAQARGVEDRLQMIARYKLGWSWLAQHQYQEAQRVFYQLLDQLGLTTQLTGLPAQQQEIAQDTLRGLGVSYYRQPGGATNLRDQGRTGGPRPYLFLVYQALAQYAEEQAKPLAAAEAYQWLATDYPQHAQAPWFLLKAVAVLEQAGLSERAIPIRMALYQQFRLDGAYWAQRDVSARAAFSAELKQNLRYLARYYHAKAQQNAQAVDWQQAQGWYQAFLTQFPDDAETPEVNYMLAECYFDAGNTVEAVNQFERTAYKYRPHNKSAEAGYAALQVLQDRYDLSPEARRTAQIASMQRFVKTFVDDGRWPQVMLRLAGAQAAAGFHSAVSATSQVALQHASRLSKAQQVSFYGLAAEAEMAQGNFELAEQFARQGVANDAGATAGSSSYERLGAVIYRRAEAALREKRWEEAMGLYLRVPTEAKTLYPAARFDAAVVAQEHDNHVRAMELYEFVLTLVAPSEILQATKEQLADIYQRTLRHMAEGQITEQLARQVSDDAKARQWLLRSAAAYRAGKDKAKALALYHQVISRYETGELPQFEARYRLAELYGEYKDSAQRKAQLRAILAARQKVGESAQARYYVGQALILQADEEAEGFRSVRLKAPLESAVREKKQKMQAAMQAYNEAANLGVAEVVTEATYKSASLLREFARALIDSERPAKLSAEELEVYQVMLEEQAFPLEERAMGLYELNLKRTAQGGGDVWTERSYQALSEMAPSRYPRNGQENRMGVVR